MRSTIKTAFAALALLTVGFVFLPSASADVDCSVSAVCPISVATEPCVVTVASAPTNTQVGVVCLYPADICTATLWDPSGQGIVCVKVLKSGCDVGVKIADPQQYHCV
jgi:hypothetical protein